MNKLTLAVSSVATMFVLAFALVSPVAAQGDTPPVEETSTEATASEPKEDCKNPSPLFPAWYDGLCKDGKIKSPADMGVGADGTAEGTGQKFGAWIGVIAMNIVKMIMVVVGYVSLGFIIWGGFKYMLSGDSSSGTVAARKTIQNAIIGLVVSIMSVALITFIVGAIA